MLPVLRRGELHEREAAQLAAIPPRDEAGVGIRAAARINPCALALDFRREDLMQQRHLEPVGEEAAPFQRAEKFFHLVARRDEHDDGLHLAGHRGARGHRLDAPHDLRYGQWGNLLQRQLHHREQFGAVALGKLRDAQKHAARREPREVQPTAEERAPVLRDVLVRQHITGQAGELLVQLGLAISRDVKAPEPSPVSGEVQDIAGVGGRGLHAKRGLGSGAWGLMPRPDVSGRPANPMQRRATSPLIR